MVAIIVHPKLAQASFGRAIKPLIAYPETYTAAGMQLVAYQFPFLDIALTWRRLSSTLLLRIDATNYRYRPIGGWWIDSDGTPLRPGTGRVPNGYGFHTQREGGEQICWFCFPGWREYHDHSSHQDRSWAAIRYDDGYSVLQLVQQLHHELNRPEVQPI